MDFPRRKLAPFQQPIQRVKVIPPPESSHWWWNPSRVDVTFAPEWFTKLVNEIDPEVKVTWDRYQERWLVWAKAPRLQSKLCSGWMLLFPWKDADGSYLPLDERIFARLYAASAAKWGRAKDYFLAIEREMERDREEAEKTRLDDVKHAAGEYYDSMQIKNIGSGSKFATHFA